MCPSRSSLDPVGGWNISTDRTHPSPGGSAGDSQSAGCRSTFMLSSAPLSTSSTSASPSNGIGLAPGRDGHPSGCSPAYDRPSHRTEWSCPITGLHSSGASAKAAATPELTAGGRCSGRHAAIWYECPLSKTLTTWRCSSCDSIVHTGGRSNTSRKSLCDEMDAGVGICTRFRRKTSPVCMLTETMPDGSRKLPPDTSGPSSASAKSAAACASSPSR